MKHIVLLITITLLIGCSYDRKSAFSQFNVESMASMLCSSADFHQTEFVDGIEDYKDQYNINIINKTNDLKEQCKIFNSLYESSADIYNKLNSGTNIPEFIYLATADFKTDDGVTALSIGYFHSEQECNDIIKKLASANIKTSECFSRILFQKRLWV
jgi:hypothetical protein